MEQQTVSEIEYVKLTVSKQCNNLELIKCF